MKGNLVEDNFKLVHYVISKMNIIEKKDYEDYFQAGVIGLISASKTFDPKHKVTFSTYSYVCIKNEILKYIKKNKNNYLYLEEKIYDDIKLEDTLVDESTNIIEEIMIKENNKKLHELIKKELNETETIVIKYIYGIECDELTQIEIGKLLNLPQYKISRIKSRAIKKLRESLKK